MCQIKQWLDFIVFQPYFFHRIVHSKSQLPNIHSDYFCTVVLLYIQMMNYKRSSHFFLKSQEVTCSINFYKNWKFNVSCSVMLLFLIAKTNTCNITIIIFTNSVCVSIQFVFISFVHNLLTFHIQSKCISLDVLAES